MSQRAGDLPDVGKPTGVVLACREGLGNKGKSSVPLRGWNCSYLLLLQVSITLKVLARAIEQEKVTKAVGDRKKQQHSLLTDPT